MAHKDSGDYTWTDAPIEVHDAAWWQAEFEAEMRECNHLRVLMHQLDNDAKLVAEAAFTIVSKTKHEKAKEIAKKRGWL